MRYVSNFFFACAFLAAAVVIGAGLYFTFVHPDARRMMASGMLLPFVIGFAFIGDKLRQ